MQTYATNMQDDAQHFTEEEKEKNSSEVHSYKKVKLFQ